MDEVEGLSPSPFAEDIVDFEDTIRGHPGYWGREDIHTANSCYIG